MKSDAFPEPPRPIATEAASPSLNSAATERRPHPLALIGLNLDNLVNIFKLRKFNPINNRVATEIGLDINVQRKAVNPFAALYVKVQLIADKGSCLRDGHMRLADR